MKASPRKGRSRKRRRKRSSGWGFGRIHKGRQIAAGLAVLGVLAILLWIEVSPRRPDDLCAIFDQNRSWYRATRRSREDWGIPEAVQLAVIRQESGFRARARPARRRFLWIFPGSRPSSAFGYGQVLQSTWEGYRNSTRRPEAQRDDFADVAHFIGWYGNHIHRRTGIAKDDAYNLYLAYHEGPSGFLRGNHRNKAWLLATARRVSSWAQRYQHQYDSCRDDLGRWWRF